MHTTYVNKTNDDWGWFVDVEEEIKYKKYVKQQFSFEEEDDEYDYYMSIYHPPSNQPKQPMHTQTHTHFTHIHKIHYIQHPCHQLYKCIYSYQVPVIGILLCILYYIFHSSFIDF